MRTMIFATLLCGATPLMSDTATVVVFDASGSMWNRLEGDLSRIEVARDVMGNYFVDRNPDAPYAIVAYGHNRRGDCSDIEVVTPMGQHIGAGQANRIVGLIPQGMTPLTDALRVARDQIPPTAESADIVLITDGLENCGGDPCALAAQFAAEGVDLRAHVVGFGMAPGEVGALACLPDQTGGLLLEATTGAELTAALAQVTPAEPVAITVAMSLFAVSAETSAPLGAADWRITDANGQLVAEGEGRDPFDIALPPGEYSIAATAPGYTGEVPLTVRADIVQRVAVPLIEDRPEASLDAPGTAPAGGTLDVDWTGPDADGDRITLSRTGAAAGEILVVTLTRNGSPASLRLPDETGMFELRYEQYNPQRILATRPVSLTATEASITPPVAVPLDERFEVDWTGPAGPRDEIVLAEIGSPDDARLTATQTRWGSPAKLKAPDVAGTYELRYRVGASGRILARTQFTVGGIE
ncbi:MAG: VWA domain-containing protein [Roseovarius sp.]|uniref:vWA domain-containing protein n=1 Tax=Roseovarius TaxID=74030 RepID=UPI001B516A5D|nr:MULTISPECIES: VWA domain-containing protein [Roseovarius]MBQ0750192.1 VWA domain-containing protein [Roseovarius sp.]MBW4976239.1 VWA domain-containing protein [Roseovarius mucosus]